jgi:Ca2+-transporting ATPase
VAATDTPRRPQETLWHCQSVAQTVERLQLDTSTGLSAQEARRRLAVQGENLIPESRGRTVLHMLVGQFTNFMILVLLAAALVSGLLGELIDAFAILVILLVNAVIGVVQEYRAERAIAALRELAAPEASVLRDGRVQSVPAREVVSGDVVLLEAGNVVPADLRLFDVAELQTDESALTGESTPVLKQSAPLPEQDLTVGDRSNMAFKGSTATRGRARGVVVATGTATEFGQIARLLGEAETLRTPLQRRLERFGRRLAMAILVVCVVVFASGVLRGEPALLMLLTAVSLAVAAIPEALPAVVTITLALGARGMSRRQALVRRLPAVETLGSVTFICSDKTGTLTENRMRAEHYVLDHDRRQDFPPDWTEQAQWLWLARAMALSNDVTPGAGDRAVGEPTELALYEGARAAGLDKHEIEAEWPRVAEVGFDSTRKRMSTLHEHDGRYTLFTKGAPEAVIPVCRRRLTGEGECALDGDALLAQAESLAGEGYRVLALACAQYDTLPDPVSAPAVEQDLTLLGLVALIDPPRAEAEAAVADCKSAGITPVMITGDHPGTARAIARRLGIGGEDAEVITGRELDQLDDETFARRVEEIRIYARVDPEQKIRIVEGLQARGQFCAMTGDGVNDAPALKQADIGVAMGMKGTDVARGASDMVLLDDNFATIVKAVREGRRIFDNIRKFIKYTMTSNSGEIWTLFLAPFLGLPIPLLPIHILWINLVTDGLPGLALSAEPGEHGIMQRPPRSSKESIFAQGMWQHVVIIGLLIGGLSLGAQAWAISQGSENWQTVVFTVLTLSQLALALSIRSERESLFSMSLMRNPALLGAVALTLALQMAVIYVPWLQPIFRTRPPSGQELAVCLLVPLIVLVAVEIEKALARRVARRAASAGPAPRSASRKAE